MTRYSPSRDIPFAVKQLNTVSPTEIRLWIMEHRTRKDKKTGRRVQHVVNPEAISNWFRRHPEIKQQLSRHINKEEIKDEGISEGLFQNGTFDAIPCIKKWTLKMHGRGANDASIQRFVNNIRQICQGIIREKRGKSPRVTIKDWGLKHPRRLTVMDGLAYVKARKHEGLTTRDHQLALRNFFKANNVENWDDISGEIKVYGKYAHLKTSREKLHRIFGFLDSLNRDASLIAQFAYKTGGSRLTACLEAHASNVNKENHTITLFEKASKHKEKRRVRKVIPSDLWEKLVPRIERGGRLFRIDKDELNKLLRCAYREIIPELEHFCEKHGAIPPREDRCPECGANPQSKIPMPFHFLRHNFGQHALQASKEKFGVRDYGLVAGLGGWTIQTLERYYGKMDESEIIAEGHALLPIL